MNRQAGNEQSALIRKRLEPDQIEDAALEARQEEASIGFLWRIWYGIRGYALDDVNRLREAGVSMVEGQAEEKHAQNRKTDAEATKIYMEAEVLRQKAARERLEAEAEKAELEYARLELEEQALAIEQERAAALERQAEAFERLRQAVSAIKAKGGDVLFDGERIEGNLRRLNAPPEETNEDETSKS